MKTEIGVGIAVATATAAAGWWLRKSKDEEIPKEWIEIGSIEELLLYPLKSGSATLCKEFECTATGPTLGTNRDRMLAVVGEDGSLVTGRDFPQLITISAEMDGWTLTLSGRDVNPLRVDLEKLLADKRQTLRIWKGQCDGVDCGDEVSQWISSYINSTVRLLFFPEEKGFKQIARVFAQMPFIRKEDGGVFSDAAAFHLINTKSVDDLNSRLKSPVIARNFRPNIVVSGEKLLPYEEDSWKWIKIGDNVFRVVGPCTRCLFTTVNPFSAEKSPEFEPLKTLQKYRVLRDPKMKALFGTSPVMGAYLGFRAGSGKVKTGDKLFVAIQSKK